MILRRKPKPAPPEPAPRDPDLINDARLNLIVGAIAHFEDLTFDETVAFWRELKTASPAPKTAIQARDQIRDVLAAVRQADPFPKLTAICKALNAPRPKENAMTAHILTEDLSAKHIGTKVTITGPAGSFTGYIDGFTFKVSQTYHRSEAEAIRVEFPGASIVYPLDATVEVHE